MKNLLHTFFAKSVSKQFGSGMITMLFLLTFTFNYNISFAQKYIWAKSVGGTGNDFGSKTMVVDNSGNVYMAGSFQGTVDFDPGTGVANLISAGGTDIFLAKYDSSGNYLWANKIGGTSDDMANEIIIASSGNLVITGSFQDTNIDFDPGTGAAYLSSSGGSDIFYAKYTTAGNYVFAQSFGGSLDDKGKSIKEMYGYYYITGEFNGSVDFDPGSATYWLTANGSYPDVFVASYNSTGLLESAFSLYGSGTDNVTKLELDINENIYLVGNFNGSIDFDPGQGSSNEYIVSSYGANDVFLANYYSGGNLIWLKHIGGTGNDYATDMVLDQNDNPVLTGSFTSTADFDFYDYNENWVYLTSSGDSDIFVARYEGSSGQIETSGATTGTQGTKGGSPGQISAATSFGGPGPDMGTSVHIDDAGNIILGGIYKGANIDFDPGNDTNALSSKSNSTDFFIAKYDWDFNYMSAISLGGTSNNDMLNDIEYLNDKIYLTGYFSGTNVDFDPRAGTAYLTASTPDIFYAKYINTNPPGINSLQTTSADTTSLSLKANIYTLNGDTAYERGFILWEFDESVRTIDDTTVMKFKQNGTFGTGQFTGSFSGLYEGTTYSVRAYAISLSGIGYSDIENFYTLYAEPTGHSSYFDLWYSASGEGYWPNTYMEFDYAYNYGATGYLILEGFGTPPTSMPSDGVQYNVDDVVGNAKVAGVVDYYRDYYYYNPYTYRDGYNYCGLYYYKLIPFNWDGYNAGTTNYRTKPVIPFDSVDVYLRPELTSNSPLVTSSSVNLSANLSDGCMTVTERGFVYTNYQSEWYPNIYWDNYISQYGSFHSGTYKDSITGLYPETQYLVAPYAINNADINYGQPETLWTLTTEPLYHASYFNATASLAQHSIYLTFPSCSSQQCQGYIIIERKDLAPTELPLDGKAYYEGDTIGSTRITKVIHNGVQTNDSITHVVGGHVYYYKLIPFNWNGYVTETYNYRTLPTIPSANAAMPNPPTLTTGSSITNLSSSGATVQGEITNTGAVNPTIRGICFSYISSNPTTSDSVRYETGSFGLGTYPINLTNLQPEKKYSYRAYATNTAGTGYSSSANSFWTYSLEPSAYPVSFTATTISSSQIQLHFSAPNTITNCDGYIIRMREDSVPVVTPSDGYAQSVGNTNGVEVLVAIVVNPSAISTMIGSLNPGNKYYFSICPFNWNGTNTETYNYRTQATIPNTFAYTIVPPTLTTSQPPTVISSTATDVTGNISNLGSDTSVTTIGMCYMTYAAGDPTTTNSTNFETGSYPTGNFTRSVTGLTAETQYKARSYAINKGGTGYGNTIDFWTFSTLPAAHAASFTATTVSTSQIDLAFSAASTITDADGYLVIMKQGSAPAGTSLPKSGQAYSTGNSIGDATVVAIINNTSSTTAGVTGLNPGNNYYFKLIPYNWDQTNTQTYNYRTLVTIPSANATTIIAPTVTTTSAITNISSTGADVEGEIIALNGTNATTRGICYKVYATGHPTITDSVRFQTGSYGLGIYSRTLSGLAPQTRYKTRAYATNPAGTGYGSVSYDFYTFSTEPAAHAASFTATTISTTQIDLTFSAASTITNALGYLIIMKQGSAPSATPTDGLGYSSGNSFGDATVVAYINSTSVTTASINGLNVGNTYHFKLIPFNWDQTNTQTYNYRTQVTIPSANATTIIAPTVTTTSVITNISSTGADVEGEITALNGTNATTRGICYKIYAAGNPTTTDSVRFQTGSYGLATFTRTLTGLAPQTRYKARAYAINPAGTGYGSVSYDFYTFSTEPAAHAASFSATTVSTSQIDLSFSAASTITNALGYLIIMKQGSAPSGTPTDGVAYSTGNSFGDATVVAYISSNSVTSASITGLNVGNTYHFKLIPFNWDQTNSQTYNYRTQVTIPSANATTIIAPTVITSSVIANIGSTGADVAGEITALNGANATTRGICYKIYATGDPTTTDSIRFQTGSFGLGTFSRTLTGLAPQTRYKARAYAINPAGTSYGSISYDFYTFSTEPAAHAASFTATTVATSQIDLAFSAASTITNAVGYLIIMKQGSAPTGTPIDGLAYSSGNTVGDATVVAFISSNSVTSASITGLNIGNTYHFKLIPFNWDQTNSQTYNYRTQVTIPSANATTILPPTLTTSALISNISVNSASADGEITLTGGINATTRGICYKVYASGDPTTIDSVRFQTGSFNTGVFTRNLTSLLPETRYKLRAYAINPAGTGYASSSIDFYTLSPEPAAHASFLTATTVSTSQINLTFPAASIITNADGYIILIKQGTPITGTPDDAVSYTIGATVGDATVCAIINSTSYTSASITSVSPGNTYYFALIPYNWNGISTSTYNYRTQITIPTANAATIVPPTVITSDIISNITDSGANMSANITATGSSVVTSRGICSKIYATGDPTISDLISKENGSFGIGSYTRTLNSYNPETHYKSRAFATNSAGTGYGISYDFYTLANEPLAHAALFSASTSSTSQIDLVFSAAKSIPKADGYIIIQKQDNAPTGLPVDGRAYAIGSSIGNGTLAAFITDTALTEIAITSVSAGNNYYFTLIPFSWDGTNAQTLNYLTSGTIPVASASTITAPSLSTSYVDSISTTRADIRGVISNTGGKKPTVRGICYKVYSAGDPLITDSTKQENGSFGTGGYTLKLSPLLPETRYSARAFASNTAGTGYGNTLDFFSLSAEPAPHANLFSAVSYSSSQIILTFQQAHYITDADGYIIIQSQGAAPTGLPVDGISYTTGSARGNGIVAGIINDIYQSSITITNLNSGTKYYYSLIPFNWNGNNPETYNYFTAGTIPQANATTLLPCSINASLRISGPSIVCQGDSVKLEADTGASLLYKWTRNNIIINGANSNVYYPSVTGEYKVFITNKICAVVSSPFSFSNYPVEPPVIVSSGTISPCTNDSMQLSTALYTNYLWSNGSKNQSIWVRTSGDYFVTVTDQYGCKVKSFGFTVNASSIETPTICLVTVDSTTGKNLIVWERPASVLIDSYYVYKESNIAGNYILIGRLGYNDLSVFLDSNSNPTVKADRYKISIIDTCGIESAFSPVHKTMHLTINKGINGENNLIWDYYEGFNFSTYKILRGTNPGNLKPIAYIQNNLTSYSDINPPLGLLFYQVVVVKPYPCYPAILRAQTNSGPYSQSVSNLKDYSNVSKDYLSVYPTEINVPKETNSSNNIKVYTSLSTWSAYSTEPWLNVIPDIANKSIFIKTNSENTDQNPRVALVIIKSSALDSVIVTVYQTGTIGISDHYTQNINLNVYPNPYVNSTNIEYDLSIATDVSISVYDVYGKPVSQLISEKQMAGKYRFRFSAADHGLPDGIYYLIFVANGERSVKKLIEMH